MDPTTLILDAQLALAKYEQKPEVWKAPLAEEVEQSELGQDQELLALAQQLLEHTQQTTVSKYAINVTGSVQGLAQGDHQQVTMNFGQSPREEK